MFDIKNTDHDVYEIIYNLIDLILENFLVVLN